MELLLNIVLLVLGFAALIKGADWFVDGSAALARTFRVPGVIIGLTIVAMGTSAPELAVSTSAALQGANESVPFRSSAAFSSAISRCPSRRRSRCWRRSACRCSRAR